MVAARPGGPFYALPKSACSCVSAGHAALRRRVFSTLAETNLLWIYVFSDRNMPIPGLMRFSAQNRPATLSTPALNSTMPSPKKTSRTTVTVPSLTTDERKYLSERENIIAGSIRDTIDASRALYQILNYQGGRLWNREFPTFMAYCQERWGHRKSHSRRLVDFGGFIGDVEKDTEKSKSPIGDYVPKNEGMYRPLSGIPKEHRVRFWKGIVDTTKPDDLTYQVVEQKVKQYRESNGLEVSCPTPKSRTTNKTSKIMEQLRTASLEHVNGKNILGLLDQVESLIG
jgi:hypothetical protein